MHNVPLSNTIDQLKQLQELEITLREATIVHGEHQERVIRIREQVNALRAQIEVDYLGRYDRLTRHGLGVVEVLHGMCMGCNMAIPQGDLNRMKAATAEPVCPHCGLFLYLN
jgi:predicted  nucleic acid-binding Zn-ribbon protein